MTAAHTPWAVIQSPTDPEMFAVQGAYLVADNLPIEDARLIAAAPELLKASVAQEEASATAIAASEANPDGQPIPKHIHDHVSMLFERARKSRVAAIVKATGAA